VIVPALDASEFNQFFAVSPGWGPDETEILKDAIMATLRARYAGFGVEFFSSDDGATTEPGDEDIDLPFLTMHVGGDNSILYGIADYIDPRNDTVTGVGITFAVGIGADTIESPFVANPVTDVPSLGTAIGQVAAHECGHLLGLRHTQNNPADLMDTGSDLTLAVGLSVSEVSQFEMTFFLPTIGIQDSPQLLLETVGGGGAVMQGGRQQAPTTVGGSGTRRNWCGHRGHAH
jgi:hypothetical protein